MKNIYKSSFTDQLVYNADSRNPVPVPPAEQGLQTIYAKPWLKISDEGLQLRGATAISRDIKRIARRFQMRDYN